MSSRNEEWKRLYLEENLSAEKIGLKYGRSGRHVLRVLRGMGVDTSKAVGSWREVGCEKCGLVVRKRRCELRRLRRVMCVGCRDGGEELRGFDLLEREMERSRERFRGRFAGIGVV